MSGSVNSGWNSNIAGSTGPGQVQQTEEEVTVSRPSQRTAWGGTDTTGSSTASAGPLSLNAYEPRLSPPNYSVSSGAVVPQPEVAEDATAADAAADDAHATATSTDVSDETDRFNNAYITLVQEAIHDGILNDVSLDHTTPPEENEATLLFAFFHPELADEAAKKLLESLGINKAVAAGLAGSSVRPPNGWTSQTGQEAFDARVSVTYNVNFEMSIEDYGSQHNLSAHQKFLLKAMFYHPEWTVDMSAEDRALLTPILAELQQAATDNIPGIPNNIPETWRPNLNAAAFDESLNVNYRANNETNLRAALRNATPPLTNAEIAQVRQYINDPTTANVPPRLINIAQGVIKLSLEQVRNDYGLTGVWSPTGAALWTGSPQVLNGVTYLSELQQIIDRQQIELSKSLPDGPGKVLFLNFLRVISEALQQMQKDVYNMESSQAIMAKSMGKSQLEAQEYKIQKHAEEVKKAEEENRELEKKQKKAGQLGAIMKIVSPIMLAVSVIMLVATAGTAGPAAFAIMAALAAMSTATTVEQAKGNDKDITMGFFNFVGEAVGSMLQAMNIPQSERTCKIIGKAIVIALVIWACCVDSGTGTAGLLGATSQAFVSSNITMDSLEASHKYSVETMMWASLSINVGVCLGAAAGAHAAEGSKQALEEAKTLVDQYTKMMQKMQSIWEAAYKSTSVVGQVGEALQKAAAATAYFFIMLARAFQMSRIDVITRGDKSTFFEIVTKSLNVATQGLGVTKAVFDYQAAVIEGNVKLLMAAAEGKDAELADKIEELKRMIKKMLEILDSLTQWNQTINDTMIQNWDKNKVPEFVVGRG